MAFLIGKYKFTKILQQKVYREYPFSTINMKVFPHGSFPVYGIAEAM